MSDKNALIQRLETTSQMFKNTVRLAAEIKGYQPKDTYARQVKVPTFPGDYDSEEHRQAWVDAIDHTADNAADQMAALYDKYCHPKSPAKPQINEFRAPNISDEKKKKMGCFMSVAGGVSLFHLASLILGTADGAVFTILLIALVAAALFVFFLGKFKAEEANINEQIAAARQEYDQHNKQLMADYEEKVKAYENECAAFKLARQDILGKYNAWRQVYLAHVEEEADIAAKLEAERVAAVEKMCQEQFNPALKEFEAYNNGLVTQEYLPVLDEIIGLLKSGRADDLKEAVNLYEEIAYRERQLELERQKEAQRQYEEEQRRADAERHHREEMAQRDAQERQRQREEERRRADAERQHREEMRQQEAAERRRESQEREARRQAELKDARERREQEAKARSIASQQCRACAHAGRCNYSVGRSTASCAGFTPRR